ncbi:hypothetical protein PIROE2DRAFT_12490 [Piromyces sp. E2]|nr:hypothetical protein PIROE2DRAFT_12490 [Piromyces sp. E2]|eukprot:OUM61492.1 hypothetical protein PIROE2DRAFT_12490 [Piromyces sp. E2]
MVQILVKFCNFIEILADIAAVVGVFLPFFNSKDNFKYKIIDTPDSVSYMSEGKSAIIVILFNVISAIIVAINLFSKNTRIFMEIVPIIFTIISLVLVISTITEFYQLLNSLTSFAGNSFVKITKNIGFYVLLFSLILALALRLFCIKINLTVVSDKIDERNKSITNVPANSASSSQSTSNYAPSAPPVSDIVDIIIPNNSISNSFNNASYVTKNGNNHTITTNNNYNTEFPPSYNEACQSYSYYHFDNNES